MHNLIANIVAQTFEKEVGRFQDSKEGKALLVSFSTKLDYSKEEGYRYLDLVYAPGNYVGVYTRERSDVASLDNDEDYVKTVGSWQCVSYHDSGWRSALDEVFKTQSKNLTTFAGSHWYDIVDAPTEIVGNHKIGR